MKIVNVIGSCSTGGAEILVKEMLINLKKKQPSFKIELWVMSCIKDTNFKDDKKRYKFEQNFINELEKNKIKVIFLEKRPKKDILKTWFKIRKLYNKFRPDIIHTHLENVTFNTIIPLLDKKIKFIQTIHNTEIKYKKIQKYLLNYKLSFFISISTEVSDSLRKIGIKNKKIIKVENGVNLKKFYFLNRQFNEKALNLIAIGRLTKQKNYKMMIDVMIKIKKYYEASGEKSPKLSIIGNGEDNEKISSYIKKYDLNGEVKLLGIREDISELLKKSDIYLMTSIYEGFSISLIEAAASGIPIVATDVGSNKKIVANEMLVQSENEKEYLKKLIKLIEDRKLREKVSIESFLKVKRYSLDNSVKKLIEIYEKK